MRRFLSIVLPALLASLVLHVPAGAAESSAQKEVRARRAAFTKAFNARNAEAYMAFISPSVKVQLRDGQTIGYEQLKGAIVTVLNAGRDLKTSATIEKIKVKGNVATLTVQEVVTYTDQQGSRQQQKVRATEVWKKSRGKWLLIKTSQAA